MTRTAVVAGCTGLIGQFLLRRLAISPAYGRVIALSRREPEMAPRIEWLKSDFADLSGLPTAVGTVDDAYCCLGTTTALAGSAGLADVDLRMVVDFARAARTAGARRFMVVSALGASAMSPFLYSRLKARMEREVAKLGFEAVHVFRPSLLVGPRPQPRFWEDFFEKSVMPVVTPLLVGPMRPLRPVAGDAVAKAMVDAAQTPFKGRKIHHLG